MEDIAILKSDRINRLMISMIVAFLVMLCTMFTLNFTRFQTPTEKTLGNRAKILNECVAFAKANPEQVRRWKRLPDEFREKGVISIVGDDRGVIVIEFISDHPISLNPAYAFAEPHVQNDLKLIQSVCESAGVRYGHACVEEGWYRAWGP